MPVEAAYPKQAQLLPCQLGPKKRPVTTGGAAEVEKVVSPKQAQLLVVLKKQKPLDSVMT